jgi:hypothetical protein
MWNLRIKFRTTGNNQKNTEGEVAYIFGHNAITGRVLRQNLHSFRFWVSGCSDFVKIEEHKPRGNTHWGVQCPFYTNAAKVSCWWLEFWYRPYLVHGSVFTEEKTSPWYRHQGGCTTTGIDIDDLPGSFHWEYYSLHGVRVKWWGNQMTMMLNVV